MVSTLILVTPFAINNLINGRFLIGALCLSIAALSIISARSCHKGEYHWGINLALFTPIILLTIPLITYQQGIIGTFWAYFAVLGFYFILTERVAWLINTLFIVIMLPVSWMVIEPGVFVRFVVMLVVTSVFAAIFIRIINEQHGQLEKQVITDPLTGLYNRSSLQSSLEHAIHQHQRTGVQMSLIMADIDHFKLINDDLGHDKGDEVIKSFGKLFIESLRGTDKVFRVGGEEFLVHNADESKAYNIAEKLRAKIEKHSLISERSITLSFGVSGIKNDRDWNQWIISCDKKLYSAKQKGRNQVAV